jgi:hypothetical protein
MGAWYLLTLFILPLSQRREVDPEGPPRAPAKPQGLAPDLSSLTAHFYPVPATELHAQA